MPSLRFTLVADGASDRTLLPVLVWLLRQHYGRVPLHPQLADLRRLHNPPRTLSDRITMSIDLYPCELLFVHRDAERSPIEHRAQEIREALDQCQRGVPVAICVIPVRMQEAWLLFDETALRRGAGNPQGRQPLDIPDLHRVEGVPDPKQILHSLLGQASGLSGRRLKRFRRDTGLCVHRVAQEIGDFSPLRRLEAFRYLEQQVRELPALA